MKYFLLALENFLPFRKRQEIPLADLGLVLVRGDNRVSRAMNDNGCLVGETLIDCPRDLTKYPRGIPLRCLVGQRPWVYAWSNGRVVVRRATKVVRTHAKAACVRVWVSAYSGNLRNEWRGRTGAGRGPYNKGRFLPPLEIVGTPEHLVLLADGVTWKPLGGLRCGDRLCSLYRRASTSQGSMEKGIGESVLYWTGGKRIRESRFIASEVWGPRGKDVHAHHKNRRSLDNRVENLQWKDATEHLGEHTSWRNYRDLAGWKVRGIHPRGMAGRLHTDAVKRRISESVKKNRWAQVNHMVIAVKNAGVFPVYDVRVPDADTFVANGVVVHNSGKTSLLSALSWCDYGETLPGRDGSVLRGDEVACRFTDGRCAVEHVLEVGGRQHTIIRCRRPAELLLDGRRAEQEEITQLIGFGSRTFRNAVVFAYDRFAQAAQGDQMRMLDEIQGVDFRAALDRAKAWRDKWRSTLEDLESRKGLLEQAAASAAAQTQSLESAKAAFMSGRAFRLEALAAAAAQAAEEVKAAAAALAAVRTKGEKAIALRKLLDGEAERTVERARLLGLHAGAERAVERARDEVERLGGELEKLIHKRDCPTCLREIKGKAEVARLRQLWSPRLTAARKALADAEALADKAMKAVQSAEEALKDHVRTYPKGVDVTERAVSLLEAEGGPAAVKRAEDTAAGAKRRQAAAVLAVMTERARDWEGLAALDIAKKAIAAAAVEMSENCRQQERARRTVAVAEYWVEAFGDRGLRSLLFDSVSGFLNDRMAYHLAFLAAGEADVQFSALRALKKGAMKEELTVSADWAWGAGSYAGGSAGQDQRIDLAQFISLQDLAESRSARGFPLRAWDEPGEGLDSQGREIFCRWVEREARRVGTGLLITHNEELAGMLQPDRTWTVVLDRDGSRVEVG